LPPKRQRASELGKAAFGEREGPQKETLAKKIAEGAGKSLAARRGLLATAGRMWYYGGQRDDQADGGETLATAGRGDWTARGGNCTPGKKIACAPQRGKEVAHMATTTGPHRRTVPLRLAEPPPPDALPAPEEALVDEMEAIGVYLRTCVRRLEIACALLGLLVLLVVARLIGV
jgi:hypothetical protein